jgi:hypothetical protein
MTGEPSIALQSGLKALAHRIVEAARLAALVHRFEPSNQHHGRRVATGGAGAGLSRTGGGFGADRPAPREAAVTDDDAAQRPTRAAGPARPPRYSEAAD